jgi:hypothetical protein
VNVAYEADFSRVGVRLGSEPFPPVLAISQALGKREGVHEGSCCPVVHTISKPLERIQDCLKDQLTSKLTVLLAFKLEWLDRLRFCI